MTLIMWPFFSQITEEEKCYGHFMQDNQSRYKSEASKACLGRAKLKGAAELYKTRIHCLNHTIPLGSGDIYTN
jgi:hypothetical protein